MSELIQVRKPNGSILKVNKDMIPHLDALNLEIVKPDEIEKPKRKPRKPKASAE